MGTSPSTPTGSGRTTCSRKVRRPFRRSSATCPPTCSSWRAPSWSRASSATVTLLSERIWSSSWPGGHANKAHRGSSAVGACSAANSKRKQLKNTRKISRSPAGTLGVSQSGAAAAAETATLCQKSGAQPACTKGKSEQEAEGSRLKARAKGLPRCLGDHSNPLPSEPRTAQVV